MKGIYQNIYKIKNKMKFGSKILKSDCVCDPNKPLPWVYILKDVNEFNKLIDASTIPLIALSFNKNNTILTSNYIKKEQEVSKRDELKIEKDIIKEKEKEKYIPIKTTPTTNYSNMAKRKKGEKGEDVIKRKRILKRDNKNLIEEMNINGFSNNTLTNINIPRVYDKRMKRRFNENKFYKNKDHLSNEKLKEKEKNKNKESQNEEKDDDIKDLKTILKIEDEKEKSFNYPSLELKRRNAQFFNKYPEEEEIKEISFLSDDE
jgi:hypothetical protein